MGGIDTEHNAHFMWRQQHMNCVGLNVLGARILVIKVRSFSLPETDSKMHK